MQDKEKVETIEIPVSTLENILTNIDFLFKEMQEFRINNTKLVFSNKEEMDLAKANSRIEAQKQIIRIKQALKADRAD